MLSISDYSARPILLCAIAFSVCAPLGGAHASGFKTLHAFAGNATDGGSPNAGLMADSSRDLYGTTSGGGTNDYGTVFTITPDGAETMLYAFAGGTDGEYPAAGVVEDSAGNLYGTTALGGTYGDGTVFKLTPDGSETVLYSFAGGKDGSLPVAGLIMDGSGNLYGTTELGGGSPHCTYGCGTVFELSPTGAETLLHVFTGKSGDGAWPFGGVIANSKGYLYGTTSQGGGTGCQYQVGCGTVFEIAPDGVERIVYDFKDGSRGLYPLGGLIKDSSGNLYGTTAEGGTAGSADGSGTVFKLAPDGTETVLYSFCAQINCSDGATPLAGLIKDGAGNLYGTTQNGGVNGCNGYGCGTVFELAPDGTETLLYAFANSHNGGNPDSGVTVDNTGYLYGTTEQGGADGFGTVFKVKK